MIENSWQMFKKETKPRHPRAKALSHQELALGSPVDMKTCRLLWNLLGQRSVYMGKFRQWRELEGGKRNVLSASRDNLEGWKQSFPTFKFVTAARWCQFQAIFFVFSRNLSPQWWDICALHPFLWFCHLSYIPFLKLQISSFFLLWAAFLLWWTRNLR